MSLINQQKSELWFQKLVEFEKHKKNKREWVSIRLQYSQISSSKNKKYLEKNLMGMFDWLRFWQFSLLDWLKMAASANLSL